MSASRPPASPLPVQVGNAQTQTITCLQGRLFAPSRIAAAVSLRYPLPQLPPFLPRSVNAAQLSSIPSLRVIHLRTGYFRELELSPSLPLAIKNAPVDDEFTLTSIGHIMRHRVEKRTALSPVPKLVRGPSGTRASVPTVKAAKGGTLEIRAQAQTAHLSYWGMAKSMARPPTVELACREKTLPLAMPEEKQIATQVPGICPPEGIIRFRHGRPWGVSCFCSVFTHLSQLSFLCYLVWCEWM